MTGLSDDEAFKRYCEEADEVLRRGADHNLRRMRAAWEKGRVREAVVDAIEFCASRQVPPPPWVVAALRELLPERERNQDLIRYERWLAVVVAHDDQGLSWEQSYKTAHEKLKGTPAQASAGTMKDDYQLVQGEIRKGNHAKYYASPVGGKIAE